MMCFFDQSPTKEQKISACDLSPRHHRNFPHIRYPCVCVCACLHLLENNNPRFISAWDTGRNYVYIYSNNNKTIEDDDVSKKRINLFSLFLLLLSARPFLGPNFAVYLSFLGFLPCREYAKCRQDECLTLYNTRKRGQAVKMLAGAGKTMAKITLRVLD